MKFFFCLHRNFSQLFTQKQFFFVGGKEQKGQMSVQQTTGMIDGIPVVFRDVWAHNLKEEMNRICQLVEKYPYIAMVIRILRNNITANLNFFITTGY